MRKLAQYAADVGNQVAQPKTDKSLQLVAIKSLGCVEAAMCALQNMGHDVTCGACMSVAFTGAANQEHTCRPEAVRPTDGELIATVRRGLEVADSSARVAFAELERRLNRG